MMDTTGTAMQGAQELVVGIFTPFILSVVSTAVRLLRYGWKGLRHFAASLTTSAFVGVTVFWGLDYANLPATVDASIISVCAYMSGTLLDTFVFKIRDTIKKAHLPHTEPHIEKEVE